MRMLVYFAAGITFALAFFMPDVVFAKGNSGEPGVHNEVNNQNKTPEKKAPQEKNPQSSESHGNSQLSKENKAVPGKGKGLNRAEQVQKEHEDNGVRKKPKTSKRPKQEKIAKKQPHPDKKTKKIDPVQSPQQSAKPANKDEHKNEQNEVDLKAEIKRTNNDVNQEQKESAFRKNKEVVKPENDNTVAIKHKTVDKSDNHQNRAPLPQNKAQKPLAVITSSQSSASGSSLQANGPGGAGHWSVFAVLESKSGGKSRLLQPYVSRYKDYRNQWMNAPPSPPPKLASSF